MASVELKNQERQKCDVYSRVTGYITPTAQWNDAKISEFKNRKTFAISGEGDTPSCPSC